MSIDLNKLKYLILILSTMKFLKKTEKIVYSL